MKKIIALYIGLVGLLCWSCTDDDGRSVIDKTGGFTLNYSVVDQGTPTKTKATIPAESGEEVIESLFLLFFEYSENGRGLFVDYYDVPVELSLDASLNIPFNNHLTLENNISYSILAVANIDQADYISESPETWIASRIAGKTEEQVIESIMATVHGAGQVEDDDSNLIEPSALLMSGRTTKQANVKEVSLELTRGLARFDVQNLEKDRFHLVSVSIWNAPVSAPVWAGDKYESPSTMERYYGIKRIVDEEEDKPLPDIAGGLYCFESFVSNPKADDKVTTCLIIGLAPRRSQLSSSENDQFKESITYHRVNIHPEDGGQNTKRNYVYKVSINSIKGEGETSEYDAWSKGTNKLNLIVNNWNLDDNGMVLTDDKHTLVIPVKRVVLDPTGDAREYSIYWLGDGQPHLSKTDLPQGISANLSGNRLSVTASPMVIGEEERKGMIEISLGNLRGEINFIQSENEDEFLTLNRYQLSSFPALGSSPIPDGYLEVTSSGEWDVKIYNNSTDATNPGFAFNLSEPFKTELTSEDNGVNTVQIYTTGANPGGEPRFSFVIFTLRDNPEITRSLVLIQKGAPDLRVTPEISSFTFQPTGSVSPAMEPYADGDWVVFNVNPGIDDEIMMTLNRWSASLDNDNFEIEVYNTGDVLADQKIKVKSNGKNLEGETLNDVLRVKYVDDSGEVSIRISQAALGLTLTVLDTEDYPVTGKISPNGIRVNADSEFTYNMQIVSKTDLKNPQVQGGFLVDGNDKIFDDQIVYNRSVDEIIHVGFAKLLTPNVRVAPEMTVRVWIDGLEDIPEMVKEFTVKQVALTPKNVNALNLANGYRGYIRAGYYDYNHYYNTALTQNSTIFGPNSSYFYMPNTFNIASATWGFDNSGAIPSSITHVNAHYAQNISTGTASAMVTWLKTYEGVLVINDDYTSTVPYNSGRLLNLLGYSGASPSGELRINTAVQNSKVYQFIFGEKSPFGAVNVGNITSWSYDGTRRVLADYPSTAIPIVVDGGNSAQILIDPVNRVVFNGELQIFNHTPYNFSGAPTTDYHRFLANFIAYIHNVSMYGSHFTDNFLEGTNTELPYHH